MKEAFDVLISQVVDSTAIFRLTVYFRGTPFFLSRNIRTLSYTLHACTTVMSAVI